MGRTSRSHSQTRLIWKIIYWLNLALIIGLIGYQVYIYFATPEIRSVHQAQIEAITANNETDSDQGLTFAVVGNIKNSHAIFRDEIIPLLNNGDFEFMVSAGNAIAGGQPESYRNLHKLFAQLEIPYLLTFGENEESDFGSFNFYEQFGPYVYDVLIGDTHFVFLDGTGKTPYNWQLSWLDRVFQQQSQHRIVFIGLPLHRQFEDTALFQIDDYFAEPTFAEALKQRFETHQVDVVFSSNLALFSEVEENDVRYVITGGAGGLMLDQSDNRHHFLRVEIASGQISITPEHIQNAWPWWRRAIVSFWGAIHSFVYVSIWRLLLIVGVLLIFASYIYRNVICDQDYYPDFDIDATPHLDKPLRVAMYSNNYFPFVSGVTISIERLRTGLKDLGDQVLAIVPTYRQKWDDESDIVRASTLISSGAKGEFRFANFLSWRLSSAVRRFKPDIIHVHHPFGLGWLGQFMGRLLNVPVVYTYHTRLEHYAHFVPLPGLIFRNLISHWLIRRFSNKCQGVIVPTHSAEEYLRLIGVRTNTLVQPTGIEAKRFEAAEPSVIQALKDKYGIEKDTKVLVSVARLSKEKNIEFMLEALALRENTYSNYKLLLVGDGPYKNRLQKCIDKLDLGNNVILTGHVEPQIMPQYYELADLFVFASQSETQGMVILEAMAAGTPVVAVRSSGIDDVIEDGNTGYKTPHNQIAWVRRINELLENNDKRALLGKQAKAFAQNYDVAPVTKRIREFYGYILAQHHEGQPWLR
ncbi:glycosyl transferase family 1 [Aliidiomarina iranensis]|uniref:Glycosyl transferase family 1 n=1 Tax=Aliidiomarina iranensis TaxID=1434071 RepID=A0A432W249_9GAMM|nr:glycosyltransferase [Aliidiomarina iranensis]RUO23287.1 glycosyl transferase family 1 [Aliidiomarina iranensis]